MGFKPIKTSKVEAAEDYTNRMRKIHEEAKSVLQKAADEMKRYADHRLKEAPTYKVGDLVWLDATDIRQNRPSRKLSDKRLGPFPIMKVINQNAYELKLPKKWRIHNVFNVSKLHLYSPPTIPGQRNPPPPEIKIDGETEYEVEEIIDSRLIQGKLQYLIKWKGYTTKNNTWEPETNLKHAQALIHCYHAAPECSATNSFNGMVEVKFSTN